MVFPESELVGMNHRSYPDTLMLFKLTRILCLLTLQPEQRNLDVFFDAVTSEGVNRPVSEAMKKGRSSSEMAQILRPVELPVLLSSSNNDVLRVKQKDKQISPPRSPAVISKAGQASKPLKPRNKIEKGKEPSLGQGEKAEEPAHGHRTPSSQSTQGQKKTIRKPLHSQPKKSKQMPQNLGDGSKAKLEMQQKAVRPPSLKRKDSGVQLPQDRKEKRESESRRQKRKYPSETIEQANSVGMKRQKRASKAPTATPNVDLTHPQPQRSNDGEQHGHHNSLQKPRNPESMKPDSTPRPSRYRREYLQGKPLARFKKWTLDERSWIIKEMRKMMEKGKMVSDGYDTLPTVLTARFDQPVTRSTIHFPYGLSTNLTDLPSTGTMILHLQTCGRSG